MRHLPPRIVAPPADALRPEPADIAAATAPALEVLAGRTVAVLSGAGLSTDSGVPDYRSPGSPPRSPMTYQQFLSDPTVRQHYWARNHLGWRYLRAAEPNDGHRAVAELERAGVVNGVITQNIDLLHVRAGSRRVVHLHGRYDRIICLECQLVLGREEHDEILARLNPGWRERMEHVIDVEVAPDADAVLASTADFVIADCPRCGGVLSPDVVFFGATTPPERVTQARAIVTEAEALLVTGSSLAVMSGLRFVRQAAKEGKPIVIVNRGPSRGDDLAEVKLEAGTGRVLPLLACELPARRA